MDDDVCDHLFLSSDMSDIDESNMDAGDHTFGSDLIPQLDSEEFLDQGFDFSPLPPELEWMVDFQGQDNEECFDDLITSKEPLEPKGHVVDSRTTESGFFEILIDTSFPRHLLNALTSVKNELKVYYPAASFWFQVNFETEIDDKPYMEVWVSWKQNMEGLREVVTEVQEYINSSGRQYPSRDIIQLIQRYVYEKPMEASESYEIFSEDELSAQPLF